MVLENAEEKKEYYQPYAKIERFTIADVIRTSGSQDDYDEEDDNPWGNGAKYREF